LQTLKSVIYTSNQNYLLFMKLLIPKINSIGNVN